MKSDKEYNMNYFSFDDLDKKVPKKADFIIFEEEDSYISSSGHFDRLLGIHKKFPPVIAIIGNKEIINIVRWMRKGASDCLWIGDLNKDVLLNSIKESTEYSSVKAKKAKKESGRGSNSLSLRKPINIPKDNKWNDLIDNNYYNLCLVMIETSFDKTGIGRYSPGAIEKIYHKIRSEAESLSSRFGGKNWFWSNNFGMQVFHFGDRADCAVLSAITFFVRFFIFCIEKLGLEEVLNIRIGIHDGKGVYKKTKTDQITSDIINSVNHLTLQHTKNNMLNITKDVFDKLSDNLKLYFKKAGSFDGRDIYSYHFYDMK